MALKWALKQGSTALHECSGHLSTVPVSWCYAFMLVQTSQEHNVDLDSPKHFLMNLKVPSSVLQPCSLENKLSCGCGKTLMWA